MSKPCDPIGNTDLDIKAEALMSDEEAIQTLQAMLIDEELLRGRSRAANALRKACTCIRNRESYQMVYSVHDGKESEHFP